MQNQFERRTIATRLTVRSAGGKQFLIGRAAAYNTLSADLGGFQETIAPGAFARAVREKDDAVFTVNHDSLALPLGRVSSGTLHLMEDEKGLLCNCDLPNTQAAHALFESVQRGDIREMSFAFNVWPADNETWSDDVDENGRKFVKRTVKGVKLWDVSAVLRPAYPSGTHIGTHAYDISSKNSVPANVLAEARSRGGVVPKPKVPTPVVLMTELERAELRGQRFASEDKAAYQADVDAFNRPRTVDPIVAAIQKNERKLNRGR